MKYLNQYLLLKSKLLLCILSAVLCNTINAQTLIKPSFLKYNMDSVTKNKLLVALDSLFAQIKNNNVDTAFIYKEHRVLTMALLHDISYIENNPKDSLNSFCKNQLMNLYPVTSNQYFITVAFAGNKNNEAPVIKLILNLLAKQAGNKIIFSTPLNYFTRNWQTTKIGNITYYYADKINAERAKAFDKNNTVIATKLGLTPEKFDFYLTGNFQEIGHLTGIEYLSASNGSINNGYGPVDNTVFAILHNEDFSHDVFHFYTDKIRQGIKLNPAAEEGFAYSWGNAFYAKDNGDMIGQHELVQALKNYLDENPQADLFQLFTSDAKIFKQYPAKVSVRSTMASLLCDEVERLKGKEGIISLIKCGPGDDNFFKVLNELVSINENNFDTEVKRLLDHYNK
jgi:hypothetical protein